MVTPLDRLLEHYRDRHGLLARGGLSAPWSSDLRRAVVIPARGEGDIGAVLGSLSACERPAGTTEVIVLVNASADDSPSVRQANAATVRSVAQWEARNQQGMRFLSLSQNRIPPRYAGVGTARKLGLDEAAFRLVGAGAPDGVLACLDADCTVAPNYLVALERHFAVADPALASVYFEHPLPAEEGARAAIVRYELHLRTYVNGLRSARATLASHTVGSCLVTTAREYLALGGMNRRQAGEDFYFVNKHAQRHPVSDVGDTCVYPSARISDRVPFGTGRAMGQASGGEVQLTYDPRCYETLRAVMDALEAVGLLPAQREARVGVAATYLDEVDWRAQVAQCERDTRSPQAYRKRVRTWFDGFKAMKLIHWLTAQHFPRAPVLVAAESVYRRVTGRRLAKNSQPELLEELALEAFRRLDREHGLTSHRQFPDVY